MNTTPISTNKINIFIFILFIVITLASVTIVGCKKREVRWGAVIGDMRDLPALVTSEGKINTNSIETQIVTTSSSPSDTVNVISTGKVDVSYLDAMAGLEAMANKNLDIEILAVTGRNKSGKPDRLLVARREWLSEFPKGADLVLSAHRNAVRFLQDNKSEANTLATKWTKPTSQTETGKILSEIRWESGMDIVGLITLLDDLRRAGDISGTKAEELASQLIKKQPPEAQ